MKNDKTTECPIHKIPLEELWKGQLDCIECFEAYHEHMIDTLTEKVIEESYEEGGVD